MQTVWEVVRAADTEASSVSVPERTNEGVQQSRVQVSGCPPRHGASAMLGRTTPATAKYAPRMAAGAIPEARRR